MRILEEEEKDSEQKIRFEGDGYGRDGNGAKYFAYVFQCWYYNPVVILSLCLLAHAYHVEFKLVKKNISGCDCVLPHVYGKTSL